MSEEKSVFCACREPRPVRGDFGGALGFAQCGVCGKGFRPVKK